MNPSSASVTSRVTVPKGLLGREIVLDEVTVTKEMIAAYARAVGDEETFTGSCREAPPTFCLSLRRAFMPEIRLPPGAISMFGGLDLEFHQPIRAGDTYVVCGRLVDVYEKSGRSGSLTVAVREVTIRDRRGEPAARMIERQIVRPGPATTNRHE